MKRISTSYSCTQDTDSSESESGSSFLIIAEQFNNPDNWYVRTIYEQTFVKHITVNQLYLPNNHL